MVFISWMFDTFQYFDKPEGTDPVNKIMGLTKFGIVTGGFFSIYDACMYSKCTNAAQFLNTAGYWMVPITGMCVAFSTVTYVATNVRKKDDKINYVLGALASGSVLQAWTKSPLISGWGTFCMVIYAILKKDSKQNPNSENPLLPKEVPHKWYFPWRNLPYRDYTSKPRWEHNKTDYYRNFTYSVHDKQ